VSALTPGRTCPVSYRYAPRVFDRAPEIHAEVLYVVGGLYGNVEALAALEALAARERSAPTVVFNGDFHWFDIAPADFAAVERAVSRHVATRGNVETEIAGEESDAGCGCAYPLDVSDAEVRRSNEILARLRETARSFPIERSRLARLPMHLVARVGACRVAIVHGDASSLAGWGFEHARLDDPAHGRWIEAMFRDAAVDVFASSHTCLPALRRFAVDGSMRVVANNGAAGMPNFRGLRHGVVTRIARAPFDGPERLCAIEAGGVQVEAIALAYDDARWRSRFLAAWPEGSSAHASYFRRIAEGPRFEPATASPRATAVA
jgi:hypothetical protein